MNGKIFILIYEKKSSYNLNLFEENNYIYLQIGTNKNLGYLKDNIGNNISALNSLFSEYTGIYWVKNNYFNLEKLDYLGFEHPDRYLLTEDNKILNSKWIEKKLSQYDFILPIKYCFFNKKALDLFLIDHNMKEIEILLNAFKELYGNDSPINNVIFNRIHNINGHYNNIFICSYKEFLQYYDFCFNIFHTIVKNNKNLSYRLFGYLGEFLIDTYIQFYNKTYYETNISITDLGTYTKKNPLWIQ